MSFGSSLSTFGASNTFGNFDSLNVTGDGYIAGDLDVGGTVTASQFSGGSITPLFLLPNGSSTEPSLAFTSSTSSGYYWDTAGTAAGQAFTVSGNKRLKLTSDRFTVDTHLDNSGNTLTTTALEAVSGTVDDLLEAGQVHAGAMAFTNSLNTTAGQIQAGDGTVALPAYAFNSDVKTGMYKPSTVGVSLATSIDGAVSTFHDTDGNFYVDKDMFVGGEFNADTIQTGSGGTVADPPLQIGLQAGSGFSFPNGENISLIASCATDEYWRLESGIGGVTKQFKVSRPLVSTSTISTGTNAMTCGALSCSSINSTGSMTSGALSCTSLTSSGTVSCGTNAMTCGSLTSGSINSGSNSMSGGRVSLTGTTTSASAGPHILHTTTADIYPLMQTLAYAHDNEYINFDTYFDGNWKSASTTSNFQIAKRANQLHINYWPGSTSLGDTINSISTTPALSVSNAGSITLTNDLKLSTLGKTITLKRGSNACSGTGAVLVAGTVTVPTTAVATGDNVLLTCTASGGTPGFPVVTISNGASFTITSSSGTDTSTYSWVIFKGN
jgi:hypothetical protein